MTLWTSHLSSILILRNKEALSMMTLITRAAPYLDVGKWRNRLHLLQTWRTSCKYRSVSQARRAAAHLKNKNHRRVVRAHRILCRNHMTSQAQWTLHWDLRATKKTRLSLTKFNYKMRRAAAVSAVAAATATAAATVAAVAAATAKWANNPAFYQTHSRTHRATWVKILKIRMSYGSWAAKLLSWKTTKNTFPLKSSKSKSFGRSISNGFEASFKTFLTKKGRLTVIKSKNWGNKSILIKM